MEDVAIHTETGEELVIYRGLHNDGQHVYARPKAMFLSEASMEDCPGTKQRYRFELQKIESQRPKFKSTS